eukprot:Opistho-1_new@28428
MLRSVSAALSRLALRPTARVEPTVRSFSWRGDFDAPFMCIEEVSTNWRPRRGRITRRLRTERVIVPQIPNQLESRTSVNDMLSGRFSHPFPTIPFRLFEAVRHLETVRTLVRPPNTPHNPLELPIGTRNADPFGGSNAQPRFSDAPDEVPDVLRPQYDTPMSAEDAARAESHMRVVLRSDDSAVIARPMSLAGLEGVLSEGNGMFATSVIRKRRLKMKKHKRKKWLKKHRSQVKKK